MSPLQKELFETIKIENGQIANIEWHNKRCNKARFELYQQTNPLKLQDAIKNVPSQGLFRCKITYAQEVQTIEYFPYQAKEIKSLAIVKSSFDYAYKFKDRKNINKLMIPEFDEIIIEKNGFLCDTSIANIAFFDGKHWITPKEPLLKGTTRARLIDEGFLTLKNIDKKNLNKYSNFALMNAMIGFQIQKNISIYSSKDLETCLFKI